MKILLLLILFFQPFLCTSFNVVGWWVGNPDNSFSMKNLNWKAYTHIRFGNPLVYPNGTAFCNKTDQAQSVNSNFFLEPSIFFLKSGNI